MFHRTGPAAYKPGLGNIEHLCRMMGHPERDLRFIHVAGTNGKGSTSHLIASALMEAGYSTGLHTSPHLVDFRERIKVDGQMIREDQVVSFVENYSTQWEYLQPSFFEITVAMCFWYFREVKVDIAVIEVGLGGRLDSTNVIQPEVSVITHIGMDHMNLLGDTIQQIAAEKAGIIKSDRPVVLGDLRTEAMEVMEGCAKELSAPVIYSINERDIPPTPLGGLYQSGNTKVAMAALHALRNTGSWHLSDDQIRKGFLDVVVNTGLMGRWQVLGKRPQVICDVAHNEDGIAWVARQLEVTPHSALHVVLGVVSDKAIDRMLRLLPDSAEYYFCKANIPRGLDAAKLQEQAAGYGLQGRAYHSVSEAYTEALLSARADDLVFIGGSFFVVGEVLTSFYT
jgi:dihydrofolate synthase / folylpolyglutamate synthase